MKMEEYGDSLLVYKYLSLFDDLNYLRRGGRLFLYFLSPLTPLFSVCRSVRPDLLFIKRKNFETVCSVPTRFYSGV